MVVKARGARPQTENRTEDSVHCTTCGEDIRRKDLLQPGRLLVHCVGSKIALGCYLHDPHHSTVSWPECWSCKGVMGCWNCMPGQKFEGERGMEYSHDGLWCQKCHVAVNFATVLAHGLPSGLTLDTGARQLVFGKLNRPIPDLRAYPENLRQAYFQHCAATGVSVDATAEEAFDEFRKEVADFKIKKFGQPTKRQLQRERNQQIEQLAEASQ